MPTANRTKQITSREIPAPLHSTLLSTPLFADIITRPNAREGGKNKDIRLLAGGLAAGDTRFEDRLFTLAFAIF